MFPARSCTYCRPTCSYAHSQTSMLHASHRTYLASSDRPSVITPHCTFRSIPRHPKPPRGYHDQSLKKATSPKFHNPPGLCPSKLSPSSSFSLRLFGARAARRGLPSPVAPRLPLSVLYRKGIVAQSSVTPRPERIGRPSPLASRPFLLALLRLSGRSGLGRLGEARGGGPYIYSYTSHVESYLPPPISDPTHIHPTLEPHSIRMDSFSRVVFHPRCTVGDPDDGLNHTKNQGRVEWKPRRWHLSAAAKGRRPRLLKQFHDHEE
jgi:hypothetical protein